MVTATELQTEAPADPEQRIRIRLPRPHPEQAMELADLSRFKMSIHGRRWGKSEMGLIAVLDGHGNGHYRGALAGERIWWVTKDYATARDDIWARLKYATEGIWRRNKGAINEVAMRITVPGGGSIQVKSAETLNRGAGLGGVVVDEAAFIKETVWTDDLRPMLSDRDKEGWAWFITSTNGKQNWVYRRFQKAQEHDGWIAWHGPATTYTITQKELDEARRDLGKSAFAQQYLAEWDAMTGAMFNRAYFRYYSNGGALYRLQTGEGEKNVDMDSCKRFTTVDLAASTKTSADYTVASTFALTKDKDLILLDVQRARMEGPDQVPLIRRVYERLKPSQIFIEKVGYQTTLIQYARRAGLPVRELVPDKDKVARACFLQARMEGGSVYFPDNAPWLGQLEDELLEFPHGEHDDQVDTLSYGAQKAMNFSFATEFVL